jgi:hypothetical protein
VAGGTDFTAATTDEALIREWWRSWPQANIGIPTGRRTNLFVVDLDTEGDQWAKAEFVLRYGVVGAAVIVGTGSGGRHCWFGRPDVPVRLSHGGDGAPFGIDGIHFRCDGGLIVAPPSRNAAGPYALLEAEFEELHPPRADLVEMLLAVRKSTTTAAGAVIRQSARNTTLTSLAGTMRDRRMTEEEIALALLAVNEGRCRPPLAGDEVRGIAASVARYEPTRPPGQFVEVPVGLIGDRSLGAWAKTVYAALGQYADWRGPRAGQTRVGVPRLAQTLGTSEATVERSLRRLLRSGWIKRETRGACQTANTTILREVSRVTRHP